jgi:hypothetical protein
MHTTAQPCDLGFAIVVDPSSLMESRSGSSKNLKIWSLLISTNRKCDKIAGDCPFRGDLGAIFINGSDHAPAGRHQSISVH